MSKGKGKRSGNNRGVTFVELMIVIGIFGALLLILGASFQGWMEKYKVEDETKRCYATLMNARARALQKNRIHFVSLTVNGYSTFEDTNTAPDGNGTFESGADARVANASSNYPISSSMGVPATFNFSRDGLASVSGWIRFSSTINEPDYDCLSISTTRINMGVFNASTGICQEK